MRHFSSSSAGPPLRPSQCHILLPQLAPRMERGRISKWLVQEGEQLQPMQVFMHVEVRRCEEQGRLFAWKCKRALTFASLLSLSLQTNELTEDGTAYVLEVESHESGILRSILVPSGSPPLAVNTPVAVFEDPDWQEGERPRGEFLWQAYVKEGAVRAGSCAPTREDAEATTTPEMSDTQPTPKKSRKPSTLKRTAK
jgi:pyruvate/2-oxoglutarate dehydrogenase complex dihydrolipoamide acyltransferase (E2) component